MSIRIGLVALLLAFLAMGCQKQKKVATAPRVTHKPPPKSQAPSVYTFNNPLPVTFNAYKPPPPPLATPPVYKLGEPRPITLNADKPLVVKPADHH